MNGRFLYFLGLYCALGFLFSSGVASLRAAPVRVEINQGVVKPEPVCVVDLFSEDAELLKVGGEISEIIRNNLKNCGLFSLIDPSSFIQTGESIIKAGIRLSDWKLVQTHFVLSGSIKDRGELITVEFRLHDVLSGQLLTGLSFSGSRKSFRRIAHKISDEILTRITGYEGMFNTQIIYVESLAKSGNKTRRRLVRMDQDGHNVEGLTPGANIIMTPRYSPDGSKVLYVAFEDRHRAQVMLLDLKTKRSQKIGNYSEMTFAPRFSPDGQSLVFSLSKDGKSAVYKRSIHGSNLVMLTSHKQIDTSPCFSPDGTQIVFTSDRVSPSQHKEHIFVMDQNGGSVRRISFGDGKYSTPIWSKNGKWIAFTKQVDKQFFIGIMRPDGSEERLIAQGFLVESASFAPNDQYIIFAREENGVPFRLYAVDLSGRFMRHIATPKEGFDPTWSPLLG